MTALVAGLGVVLSLTVVGTTPAHADTILVTTTNDDGPGSLREALAEAVATDVADQITFAPSVTGTILLTSGELEVVAGASSGNLTIEGPGSDVLAVDAGRQSRVLDVSGRPGGTRPSVVVSGLTLTGGVPAESGGGGAALRATGTDVTLEQMVVSDSWAGGPGGGVSLQGGSLLVTASTITGNGSSNGGCWCTAPGGGGIYFDGAEATGASLEVRDSTISDNRADSQGGGIHSEGRATVTRSTVNGNTAASAVTGSEFYIPVGEGGGIWAGDLTVVDSHIVGNAANRRGGGLVGRSVVVTRSTIVGNVAYSGGGIGTPEDVGADDVVRVESSTVTGNRADYGGGLYLGDGASAAVTLSTVAANLATTGGGLYSNIDVALRSTIVAINSGGDLAGEGSAALDHSLVEDPRGFPYVDSGGSIIGEDPRLGPLGDHGGPTETMPPASNSPVIDAGSAMGETTDQRGSARPVNDAGTPDAVDGSDIGAVELTQEELTGPPQVGNTEPPTITGPARVGETLHTDGGTWAPEDVSLSYQWLRDGVPIDGATSASYTLTPDDFGRYLYGADYRKRLAVRVTAAAAGHRESSRVSEYTDYVTKGVLTTSRRPQVTGKLKVGSTLRAWPHLRAVSPRPRSVGIGWFLNDRQVYEANGQKRFGLKPRMRGKRVTVEFTYYRPKGYRPLTLVVKRNGRVR